MSNIGSVGRTTSLRPTEETAPTTAATPEVQTAPAGLGIGARGEEVRTVQTQLQQLGVLRGTADGIFGRGTQSAVASFQRSNGLPSTGEVDAATKAKLASL